MNGKIVVKCKGTPDDWAALIDARPLDQPDFDFEAACARAVQRANQAERCYNIFAELDPAGELVCWHLQLEKTKRPRPDFSILFAVAYPRQLLVGLDDLRLSFT